MTGATKRAREACDSAEMDNNSGSGYSPAIAHLSEAVKELAWALDDALAEIAALRGDSPGLEH